MAKKKASEVKFNLKTLFLVINVILGGLLIGLGIASYVGMEKQDNWYENPWYFFVPSYTIIFGCLLIAAEFQIKFIQNQFAFLNSYFGRGIFLIYLASVSANAGSFTSSKTLGIICCILFAIVGIIYTFFGCFFKKEQDGEQAKGGKPQAEKA
ncbi:hypothetical protein PPERSA_08216 [Pseudocohnilembus persalinus]|uniref:COPI associated protein n=1 Tax=Pseudocohnilembus persalinus TaxID=266149 RepID=A0A0V0QFY6_PSEPJ|nr:hypothetical protein PPERSA_08216 [Pseudocohnilembus persalinus]|eukprot:KRX01115.1 hypothetical protein PPERSA_08216 [Pseudocohnilembus persalinus]